MNNNAAETKNQNRQKTKVENSSINTKGHEIETKNTKLLTLDELFLKDKWRLNSIHHYLASI